MSLKNLKPNFDAAKQFLMALSDGEGDGFSFQTFDDAEKKNPKFARIFHGSLENNFEELCFLNQQGAGIFGMVNKGDLRGRKAQNTVALRSAFADKDDGIVPDLKLPPSALIQSKRGLHPYYFLIPGEPLPRFLEVQEALIENLGSDKVVKDLSRVMRLPGFFHLKDPSNPFMVHTISLEGHRYSIDEVLAAYPHLLSLMAFSHHQDPIGQIRRLV